MTTNTNTTFNDQNEAVIMRDFNSRELASWESVHEYLSKVFDPTQLDIIKTVHSLGFNDGCVAGRESMMLTWTRDMGAVFDRLESITTDSVTGLVDPVGGGC